MPLDYPFLLNLREVSLRYYAMIYPESIADSLILCAVATFLIIHFLGLPLYRFAYHNINSWFGLLILASVVSIHAISTLQLWLEIALADDWTTRALIGITAIYFSVRSYKVISLVYVIADLLIYKKFFRPPKITDLMEKD